MQLDQKRVASGALEQTLVLGVLHGVSRPLRASDVVAQLASMRMLVDSPEAHAMVGGIVQDLAAQGRVVAFDDERWVPSVAEVQNLRLQTLCACVQSFSLWMTQAMASMGLMGAAPVQQPTGDVR